MNKLLSMEVFVAVVEAGGFSAVADRFSMSAPMVGRHVRHLEEQLGARLLTRTTRRQSLTEIGRLYYERCRQILADIRAAESSVEVLRVEPRGLLRISAPVTLGTQALTPLVAEYLMRYPQVSIELLLDDRVVDLVGEGIDAAIRIGQLQDSTLVSRPLAPYRMVIAAAPAYLARAGTPTRPDELARHHCLGFTHWGRYWSWPPGGESDGVEAASPNRFRTNNGQALRMAALAGLGIILQPEVLMADELASGRLVPLLADYTPAARPVQIVYPQDRLATPKLTRFVEFVRERLGE
ncbi:LysR family transcriptional regulator [Crenobacter sp. SG2303]|uniref:LysR family transcriptional regulator n=1 Tax=Crenobacter oryzisoli TaxID=3056844 RepID=A0ABT7XRY1_9NEIS|nr:LysR family transcriptional regulator [Crenobacter sp. SG2303]MDN0076463.1 LysR family transcriptional regulator [Crenobacter sp. SG2303]